MDAQITTPLRDHVFRELEPHPKRGRVSDTDREASAPLPRAELVQNAHLRQWNAVWVQRARRDRQESRRLRQHARELHARYQHWRQRYLLVECAWCQKHLSWQYMEKPMTEVPPTSHGVCPSCFETQWRVWRLRRLRHP